MPFLRSLAILLVLLTPALAQDGAGSADIAKVAAQALADHLDVLQKSGERPDYTKPPAATQLRRVFDFDALAALPAPKADDIPWLLTWTAAATRADRLILFFGSQPGAALDTAALARNVADYEDQYAAAMDFLFRIQAREASAAFLFMDHLGPQERTPERAAGFQKVRDGAAEFVTGALISLAQGLRPANARRMTAAMRDTGTVWAAYLMPDARARFVGIVAQVPPKMDAEVRANLSAFADALAAAK